MAKVTICETNEISAEFILALAQDTVSGSSGSADFITRLAKYNQASLKKIRMIIRKCLNKLPGYDGIFSLDPWTRLPIPGNYATVVRFTPATETYVPKELRADLHAKTVELAAAVSREPALSPIRIAAEPMEFDSPPAGASIA